jgi:RepB DNA-primase from phage plasmid
VRESIPRRDALYLQLAALAGNEPPSSYLEIRCLRPDGRPGPREFVPVRELHRAVDLALALRDVHVYLSAAPRVCESGTVQDVERVHCLWADCDTAEAVAALRRFKPTPSIVAWTSPGRAQALWPLRRRATPAGARRANRRIAHALGADMAATDPARILRAIGTFNHKRQPPVPVTCARCELDAHTLTAVIGPLPDAPGETPHRPKFVSEPSHRSEGSLAGLVRTVREAAVGERNGLLFWAACTAREEGHSAREELRAAALDAGLAEVEVERTLDSAERRAAA